MSQEQQNQVDIPTQVQAEEPEVKTFEAVEQTLPAEEADNQSTSTAVAEKSAGKKRSKRKGRWVNAEDIMPRPSYWPILLAFSLLVLLLGIAMHPIVLAIGVLLTIGSVIGWVLERR